jgi:hypothetical protein
MNDTATPRESTSDCSACDLRSHMEPSGENGLPGGSTTPVAETTCRTIAMKLAVTPAPVPFRIDIDLEKRRSQIRKANESI